MVIKLSQYDYISRAIQVHGNNYDLSKVMYTGWMKKVEVICRVHGSFMIRADAFIEQFQGCSKCKVYGYSKISMRFFELLSNELGINI